MKKSIVKKMMARILSHPYQALNGLTRLICIKEQEEKYKSEHLKECFPFLKDEDLEINNVSEILESLEEKIVKKINNIAQDKDNKNLYELTALVMALDIILDGDDDPEELVEDDRVQLCYDLGRLIIENCNIEEAEFWFNKALKKLSFN